MHKTVAEYEKSDRSYAEVHQVFHNDVASVFRAGEAGLDHGEARLHEENEADADEYPEEVSLGQRGVYLGQVGR